MNLALQEEYEDIYGVKNEVFGEGLGYLRALIRQRKNRGVIDFKIDASQIFYGLDHHMPVIRGLEDQRAVLLHHIEYTIYPLVARFYARAVEITITISQDPDELKPPPVVGDTEIFLAVDAEHGVLRHTLLPPYHVLTDAATIAICSGITVQGRPIGIGFHRLQEDRGTGPGGATSNLPDRDPLNRFKDPLNPEPLWPPHVPYGSYDPPGPPELHAGQIPLPPETTGSGGAHGGGEKTHSPYLLDEDEEEPPEVARPAAARSAPQPATPRAAPRAAPAAREPVTPAAIAAALAPLAAAIERGTPQGESARPIGARDSGPTPPPAPVLIRVSSAMAASRPSPEPARENAAETREEREPEELTAAREAADDHLEPARDEEPEARAEPEERRELEREEEPETRDEAEERREPEQREEPEERAESEERPESERRDETEARNEPEEHREPEQREEQEERAEPEQRSESERRDEPEARDEPEERREPEQREEPEARTESEERPESDRRNEPEARDEPDRSESERKEEPEARNEPSERRDEEQPKPQQVRRETPEENNEPARRDEARAEPGERPESSPREEARAEPENHPEPEAQPRETVEARAEPESHPAPAHEETFDERPAPTEHREPEPAHRETLEAQAEPQKHFQLAQPDAAPDQRKEAREELQKELHLEPAPVETADLHTNEFQTKMAPQPAHVHTLAAETKAAPVAMKKPAVKIAEAEELDQRTIPTYLPGHDVVKQTVAHAHPTTAELQQTEHAPAYVHLLEVPTHHHVYDTLQPPKAAPQPGPQQDAKAAPANKAAPASAPKLQIVASTAKPSVAPKPVKLMMPKPKPQARMTRTAFLKRVLPEFDAEMSEGPEEG